MNAPRRPAGPSRRSRSSPDQARTQACCSAVSLRARQLGSRREAHLTGSTSMRICVTRIDVLSGLGLVRSLRDDQTQVAIVAGNFAYDDDGT